MTHLCLSRHGRPSPIIRRRAIDHTNNQHYAAVEICAFHCMCNFIINHTKCMRQLQPYNNGANKHTSTQLLPTYSY